MLSDRKTFRSRLGAASILLLMAAATGMGRVKPVFSQEEPPRSLTMSEERLFVLGGDPPRLFQVSPVTGAVLREIPVPEGNAISPPCGMAVRENELFLAGEGERVFVLDTRTGRPIRSFTVEGFSSISGLALVPGEGLLVASGSATGGTAGTRSAYVSPEDGAFIRAFPGDLRFQGLDAGPLGRLFVWNPSEGAIEERHETTGDLIDSTPASTILTEEVTGLGFSGRNLFVSGTGNSALKVVDPRSNRVVRAFPAPRTPVCALAAGPPLRPDVVDLPPDRPFFNLFGSFRSTTRNIAAGRVLVYPDATPPASAVTLIDYEYTSEYPSEVFSATLTADSFGTPTGVFHLYGVGRDDGNPPFDTAPEMGVRYQVTVILDSEGPDLFISHPRPDQALRAGDTIPGTSSFPVYCFADDFPAGLSLVELWATPADGTPELIASSTFNGRNTAFIGFVWSPLDDGAYTLNLRGVDRFGNQSSSSSVHVLVDRAPRPVPGDPLPTAAVVLFSSPPLEILSSVTVAELDGDAEPEFVFGTDRTGSDDQGTGIYAVNLDGTPVTGHWPVVLDNDVRSSPAVADLDRDGRDEIVVGTYGPPHTVRILDHDGSSMGQADSEFSIISSPAIGNLDTDLDLEIVVGTSDGTLLALQADGSPLNDNWPVVPPRRSPPFNTRNDLDSSPAVGDITGDGTAEVLVISDDGILYAYQPDGNPVPGFPFIPPAETFHQPVSTASNFASPILADVDGDGIADVIAAFSNCRVYALRGDGALIDGFPIRFPLGLDTDDPAAREGDNILSTPAVGDMDGDGLLELAVAFYDGTEDETRLYLFDLAAPVDYRKIPWSAFQEGGFHTGFHPGVHDGDLNRDGTVDLEDGIAFIRCWYRRSTMPEYEPVLDFDWSLRIDSKDLLHFLEVTER